jgi:hypothetical protein
VLSDISTPNEASANANTQAKSHFSSAHKIAPQTISHCSPERAVGRPLFFSAERGASPRSIAATWSYKVRYATLKSVSPTAERNVEIGTPRAFKATQSWALNILTSSDCPADKYRLGDASMEQKKHLYKKNFFANNFVRMTFIGRFYVQGGPEIKEST